MKARRPLFLILILISTLITPILSLGNLRWSSVFMADTEILWVSEYNGIYQSWDERNAPSPYLADESIGYIHEVKTKGAKEGYFGFEDPSGKGIINNVNLNLECYGDDTNDLIDIWLNCSDGLGWVEEGTIIVNQLSYDWEILNFTTRLDSWNDIQNAQIYLSYQGVGGGDDIYVRRAYLSVDYESEPEPSPDPQSNGNPGWLSEWAYRKSHVITGSIDGDMYNYSFQFKIYYGDGVDGIETINAIPSGKIYLNETSQGNFDDLRITESDGSTLLPIWIDTDSVVVNNSCLMWTKITYVPESPANTTIYIYWGNDEAPSVSNVIDTFIFGDDFEDTPIDDPPDANRWDLSGVDASDWILVKANPAGDGQVAKQHETADGAYTLMSTKTDYFTNGLYRILNRIRPSPYESYGNMKADNDAVNLWNWMIYYGDYKWHNNAAYIDTGKNMGVNTWYVLGYWMNSFTDGDAYINDVLAASNTYRVDPTVGLSRFTPIQQSKFGAYDSWQDYILIMNFTANEPTHVDWGSLEEAPKDDILNKGIIASDSTVDDEQWFFLNASIEVLEDSAIFLFNRIDIDPDGLNLSCSFTNATNIFAEENDPNNYLQLDPILSEKTDLNNTFVRIDYYLRIHFNVTKDGVYNVNVYSTASGDLSDTDNYASVFTLTIRTPSAPSKLFGAGFNATDPYVELHWTNNLELVTFFEVQNSSNKVDWSYLGQNTINQYTDFQVVNGIERYYKVRACRDTGVGWKNSTFTDINFETVYFIPAEVNVTGAWVDYNFTSIVTLIGENVTGFLNSTYFKDDDFYNVTEPTGTPGYDIRFNVSGLPDSLICVCLDIYASYDGSLGHTFQIEVWNFTDSSWDFVEDIPDECCKWFNNTLECVPIDYVQNGLLMGRFYHPSPGNVNHLFSLDYGRLRVFVPYPVTVTGARPEGWVLTIMIAAIGVPLIILGSRRRRK